MSPVLSTTRTRLLYSTACRVCGVTGMQTEHGTLPAIRQSSQAVAAQQERPSKKPSKRDQVLRKARMAQERRVSTPLQWALHATHITPTKLVNDVQKSGHENVHPIKMCP